DRLERTWSIVYARRTDWSPFPDLLRLRHRDLYYCTKQQKRDKAKTHEIISLCLGLTGKSLSRGRDAHWLFRDRGCRNPFTAHFGGSRRQPGRLCLRWGSLSPQ